MGEPLRLPLQRASALIGRLRASVEQCEPCAFKIRDVHNAIIASLKPLVEAQQALLSGGGRCVAALREAQRVAAQCAQQAAAMQQDILATRSTQELAAELAAALDTLKAQPVDPLFIGGEAGHTLYDFVDESSVDSLQQQLQGELSEMEAIYRSCYATTNSFDQQMRYLNGLLGAVMPVVYPSGAEDTSAVDAVGVLMTAIKQRCSLPAVDTVEMMPLQVLMQGWKTYAMELEVNRTLQEAGRLDLVVGSFETHVDHCFVFVLANRSRWCHWHPRFRRWRTSKRGCSLCATVPSIRTG